MQILAWLCPFLYLAATMGSILNGLGCTRTTFLQSVAAMLLRLVFVVAGIPLFGIYGYLCGMLISEIFLALAHLWSLSLIHIWHRHRWFRWSPSEFRPGGTGSSHCCRPWFRDRH